MRKLSILLCVGLLTTSFVNGALGYHTVELFRDNFDGNSLDLEKWQCRTEIEWRQSGITRLVGCPEVNGGMAAFSHHTYNPYDVGNSCLSQEIFSRQPPFEPNAALQFKARVRLRAPVGNGLVAGFYTYMEKTKSPVDANLLSDEIDYEFFTNQINDPYPVFLGDRVNIAAFNDFDRDWTDYLRHWWDNQNVPRTIMPGRPQLNLTQFNIFIIRWLGDRVEWYWDPNDGNGEILIYKTNNVLPDEPMAAYFNFWAADEYLPIAWDENMEPAARPEDDSVSYYDVDYVIVEKILPDNNCDEVRALGYILPADYNKDCKIDFEDFAFLANDWLKDYRP